MNIVFRGGRKMFIKKRFVVFCVILTLFFCIGGKVTCSDAKSKERIEFEDGSYCITTIIIDETRVFGLFARNSVSNKSASKYANYYNASGKLLFTTRVTATISYDGHTSRALSASCGYGISDGSWSYVSGRADISGSSATAICTFKSSSGSRSLSATISCSPTGTIS